MYVNTFLRLLSIVVCTVALAAGTQASERAYKWVDKDGVVHYDQQPPTEAKSEALKIQQGFSTTAEDEPAEMTDEQKLAAAAAESCRVATENFTAVTSGTEVKRKDEYGETHVMSAEEKEAAKASSKAAMDKYCKPESATTAP